MFCASDVWFIRLALFADACLDHEEDPTSQAALDKIQSRSERKARKASPQLRPQKSPRHYSGHHPQDQRILYFRTTAIVISSLFEDMNAQAQLSAAQHLSSSAAAANNVTSLESSGSAVEADEDDIPNLEAPDDDGPVDETGVDAKDVDLVMNQVGCSRAKAIRVLKESGGDLINAIMAASE
ncbi:hypothetical protein EDD16DRAFT_1775348 [Pisolithus croceorrhizus]|nr:hypothetical protein EDD16DRAFT_1775348 [Pisolithus croceorrhizus]